MDREEQVLVGSGAEDVGDGPELEGPERSLVEVVGESELKSDDASDDIFGQGFGTAELGNLS